MIGFLIGILQFYKDRNFPTSIRSICGTYIAAFALVMRLMPHILPQFDHQYLIIRIIMNMYWTVVCPCNPTTYIKTVGVPHKWLIASPYGSDGGSGTSRSFSSRSGIMIGWKQNSNVDRTEGSVIGLRIFSYVSSIYPWGSPFKIHCPNRDRDYRDRRQDVVQVVNDRKGSFLLRPQP